jgi:hypothetical protein
MLHEGLLRSIKSSQAKKISSFEVELPDTFLQEAYRSLSNEIQEIRLPFAGKNDRGSLDKLCKKLGVSIERQSFGNLLIKMKEQNSKLLITKPQINLQLKPSHQSILIDIEDKEKESFTFQIFKADRYTGLSSLEERYTSSQLTNRLSFEATIISLLGLASSYISGYNNNYYFLFLSPDEASSLISQTDSSLIDKYFRIKDEVVSAIRAYINSAICNEVLSFELMLNTTLQKLVLQENLNKISLVLFRVAMEGGQTYKLYEILPITIYGNSVFNEKVEAYIRRPQEFITCVERMLDPKGVIIRALNSISRGKPFIEANNVLSFILYLYRFVTFGSIESLYASIRELLNAYEKTKKESQDRSEVYLALMKHLSVLI